MATEPKYEEDLVNLGYLNKIINNVSEDIKLPDNISKHYSSKPQPPYHKGDTWIDGTIVYTCINDREIGIYVDTDWVTESGAREEAEKKNKVFLRQPSNYSVGDMWILQSDEDHRAGKKGEMLISTAGRKEYDSDDWVNMLGYGTIRSINEVANNINDALKRLNIEKRRRNYNYILFYTIPENPISNDLWYVTEDIDNYSKEKLYKYNGENWELIKDNLITVAFEEANQDRLISDGKIQSFYKSEAPLENVSVGDIWNDTTTKKLYRYNGTNWVAVYDTNISEIRKNVETVTETTVQIQTDLGGINQRVNSVETTITTLGQIEKTEGREITVDASNNPAKLYVHGNTEQATRSEKNLVNVFETLTTDFGTLPTLSISEDGFVSYENTSGYKNVHFNTFEVEPNTYYYSYLEVEEGNTANPNVLIREYNENMESIKITYPKNQMLLTSSETRYIKYGLTTNGQNQTGTFKARPMVVKSSSADNVYEPYGVMPSPDYPSDIRNVGDNIQLLDVENASKGYYFSTTGELTEGVEGWLNILIKAEPNKMYTFSGVTLTNNTIGIAQFDSNKEFVKYGISYKNGSFTTENTTEYLGVSIRETEANEIKLEKGSIATSHTKYNCGSVDLKVENKNKCKLQITMQAQATATLDNDKITMKPTATTGVSYIVLSYREFEIGKKYTVSFKTEGNYRMVGLFSGPYTLDSSWTSTNYAFTLQEGNNTNLALGFYINNSSLDNELIIYDIQIEEGEVATDYVEHQEQIVSFPFAEGQLLHKGDYLAEDGIHQLKQTIIYDGTEEWLLSTSGNFYIQGTSYKTYADGGTCISTHFPYGFNLDNHIWIGNADFIIIRDTRYTTVKDFKTYLAEQYANGTPVTVEYELAEEIVIPYTPEQQKVLDSIETFKGINHIYCIDEITPEKMILTYYPNTPYNDTLVNKDKFDKVTTEMNAEFNIRANEIETSVKESTTASILTLLNNGYLTKEQVNALVNGNAEDIATVKEQLTQTVTSSQMQIEITKAIEGGVSYLKNTLFTIDENGMWIATSQDEFNALYNNKGMYLYSFDEMIAKFDVNGATITGNLNLEGEFITPNLRMMNVEVDGVAHTHIHWIGG